jgi:signal transduction histidine kinase
MLNAVNHTYEYNIDGGQWNSISGPSYINIFKLDPGIYTINVRAFDEFGTLISFPKLQIEAKVPFLKSRLFLLLLILTAFIFLFLFVLVLMRSSLQEQKLKERISMDLHDEVGTILTRALYVARSDEQTAGNSRLINYLNESLFSLRAYINTMNYSTFTFRKLTDEIKEMVNALLNMTGVKYEVTEKSDGDYQIKGELFRDIRLCLYEIISNTLKHSRARNISVYVTAHNHVLTIFTRDNGVLMDVAALGQKGNGMKNLRKRVSKHHGTIEFSTPKQGSGLGIKMRFPL